MIDGKTVVFVLLISRLKMNSNNGVHGTVVLLQFHRWRRPCGLPFEPDDRRGGTILCIQTAVFCQD
jgi:hypothetical protein